MWAPGVVAVLLGQTGLYALWPSRGLPPVARRRGLLAVGSLALVVAGSAGVAADEGGVGLVLVLSAAMAWGSVLTLTVPAVLGPPAAARARDARRGRLRHAWAGREGWSKAAASLVGGFVVFVLASLWFPLVLPALGASMEAALAAATLLTLPGWVGLVFACLAARRGATAVAGTVVGAALLALTAALAGRVGGAG